MNHEGYTIKAHKEHSLDHDMKPVSVTSYNVTIGKKLVAVGLPSIEAAKDSINRRAKIRQRAGLEAAG